MQRIKASSLGLAFSTTPAATLSLGFLTLGGFVGGVMFWGAFNTALELTNTEQFCTSCHEMEQRLSGADPDGPFLQPFRGPRLVPGLPCAARMDRQDRPQDAGIEGSLGQDIRHDQHAAEIPRHRLELAEHEWARLKANDSLECRNCHSSVAMDLTKQTARAAEIHTRYLLSGKATCIDCHKGIAHELPNMEGVDPGWKAPPELQGEKPTQSSAIDELERLIAAYHPGR